MSGKTIGWGFVGLGYISRFMARALKSVEGAELAAVTSLFKEEIDAFTGEFPVKNRHEDLEGLLADPGVDVVYIAVPNDLHREFAIRAARAGKHILCEKPLAPTAAEARVMVEAARDHKVFLMEAFMYRHHPQMEKILSLVKDEVGEVRLVNASFGIPFTPDGSWRLRRKSFGGSVMDLGGYCTLFCRAVVGEEPKEVKAVGRIGAGGVDEWATACLSFPNGALATVTCGMRVLAENTAEIYGTKARVLVRTPWILPWPLPAGRDLTVTLRRPGLPPPPPEVFEIEKTDPYAAEARHVCACIREGRTESPVMSGAATLGNLTTMDAIRRSLGVLWEGEVP